MASDICQAVGYGTTNDTEPSSYQHSEQLESQSLLQEQRRQELMQTEGEMEFNNSLIEEREAGIMEIQQQIGEVNEIFQDLAVLVNEQGQMIDDIEANIVSTAVRTKAGPAG